VKIKTSELIGPALDWAVAKCEKRDYIYSVTTGGDYNGNTTHGHRRSYSTDWSYGGPIIEREKIATQPLRGNWFAGVGSGPNRSSWSAHGPTPLIAAMRCYVASKLGDEVEVPNELQ
jgi:hypothetical protein